MSLSLRAGRAGRTRRLRARFSGDIRRKKRRTNQTETRSWPVRMFPPETSRLRIQIQAPHHRAFHDGAVLSVVNALRCASTRPAAGPAGIDDASARHVSGSYAMVVRVMVSRMALTRESRRSMLASSRQCRTAHPPFAPRANGARIRPAPTGHGIERILLTSPQSYLHAVSCEHRDLSPRIVLRTVR